MRYEDFIFHFKKQVFDLDNSKQLELSISICKRLYADYFIFTETHKWGDPDILLDAIKYCDNVNFLTIDESLIDERLIQVEKITPHMDDYGDEISSYALNACVAVYETLQFLIDRNPKRVFDVGICLTDTIDFKIQEVKDLSDTQIDEDPLMIEATNFLMSKSK